jgi:hypothetical protein
MNAQQMAEYMKRTKAAARVIAMINRNAGRPVMPYRKTFEAIRQQIMGETK